TPSQLDASVAPEMAAGQKTGVGIAAAVSANLVSDHTQASISGAGHITAGDVSLTTENKLFHVAATGGAAFSSGGGTSTTDLAGAFSFNNLDVTTRSFIVDTDVT